jgi:MFS family permease
MARTAAQSTESSPQKLTITGLRTNMALMLGMLLAGGLVTWILFTDGIADIVWTISYNLMPLYQEEIGGLSIQQIGLTQAVFGVSTMIVTIPAGLLADKKGERYSISASFMLLFLAFYVFITAKGFWGFAVAAAILGLSSGMMNPAYGSLISKAAPEKLRGTAYGLFSTSLGIISLPAPAIGALLWERINPTFPFRLIAWFSLLAVLPAWLKLKIKKSNPVGSPVDV